MAVLTGCSSFHGEWRAAGEPGAPAGAVAGRWEGRWLSDRNGHTGPLRAALRPEPDGTYHAAFRGKWWRVFTTAYDLTLHAEPQPDGTVKLAGERRLFPLGAYRFEGVVAGTNLNARYAASVDEGVVELRRAP